MVVIPDRMSPGFDPELLEGGGRGGRPERQQQENWLKDHTPEGGDI